MGDNERFVSSGNLIATLKLHQRKNFSQLVRIDVPDKEKKRVHIPNNMNIVYCYYCGHVTMDYRIGANGALKAQCPNCMRTFSFSSQFMTMSSYPKKVAGCLRVKPRTYYSNVFERPVYLSVDKVYYDTNKLKCLKFTTMIRSERFYFEPGKNQASGANVAEVNKLAWTKRYRMVFDFASRSIYYMKDKTITPVLSIHHTSFCDAMSKFAMTGCDYTRQMYLMGFYNESDISKIYDIYILPMILEYYKLPALNLLFDSKYYNNLFMADMFLKYPIVSHSFLHYVNGQYQRYFGYSDLIGKDSAEKVLTYFYYEMFYVYWCSKYDKRLKTIFNSVTSDEYNLYLSGLLQDTFGEDDWLHDMCLKHPLAVCFVQYLWQLGWRDIKNVKYIIEQVCPSLPTLKSFLAYEHVLPFNLLYKRTHPRKFFFKKILSYQGEKHITQTLFNERDFEKYGFNFLWFFNTYEQLYKDGFKFDKNAAFYTNGSSFYELSWQEMQSLLKNDFNPFNDSCDLPFKC